MALDGAEFSKSACRHFDASEILNAIKKNQSSPSLCYFDFGRKKRKKNKFVSRKLCESKCGGKQALSKCTKRRTYVRDF